MKYGINCKNNHYTLIYLKKLFLTSSLVNTSIPGIIPGVIPGIIPDDIHLINSSIVLPKSLEECTDL